MGEFPQGVSPPFLLGNYAKREIEVNRWFAFEMGPSGGISTNAVSGPLETEKEARAWANARFFGGNSKAAKIGIAQLVLTAEREVTPPPPIKFVNLSASVVTEGNTSDSQEAA